ncbi:MAG: hypothetical protein IJV31_07465 [Clostridia bacterium]|nr:hypothetical protein [Clostridia bacterium]
MVVNIYSCTADERGRIKEQEYGGMVIPQNEEAARNLGCAVFCKATPSKQQESGNKSI